MDPARAQGPALGQEVLGQARPHDEPQRHGRRVEHDHLVEHSSRMRSAETMDSRRTCAHRGRQRRVGLEESAPRSGRHRATCAAGRHRTRSPGRGGVRKRPAARSLSPSKGSIRTPGREPQRQRVDGEGRARQVDHDVVAEGHLRLARLGHVDLRPVRRDLVDLRAPAGADGAEPPRPASRRRPPSPAAGAGSRRGGRRSSGRRRRRARPRPGTHRRAPSHPPSTASSLRPRSGVPAPRWR